MLYDLHQTDVCLFPTHTYHQINAGNLVVDGFQVTWFFWNKTFVIPIENQKGDLTVVHNSQLTSKWIATQILIELLGTEKIMFIQISSHYDHIVLCTNLTRRSDRERD